MFRRFYKISWIIWYYGLASNGPFVYTVSMSHPNGYLYCARAGEYIKIGFALDPKRRIYGLRCRKSPHYLHPKDAPLEDMKLEGMLIANGSQEKEFHQRYRYDRIPGTREWYPAFGKAHTDFGSSPGYIPEPPKWFMQMDEDPLEAAIRILERLKTDIRIQRYRGSLTMDEASAWYSLDRASEYLCRQL